MLKKDKIIQEKYKGIHPTCLCGCGKETRYEAKLKDFCKYVNGHQSRRKGFWNPQDPKRIAAIIKTRKEKFASGEYNHIKEAVKQNRKDPGLGKKISDGAKGIAKPKPKGFGVGRIQSAKTKEKMSKTAKYKWETGDIGKKKHYTSKLEKIFANILELLDIEYTQFYYAKDIKAFYDFYLPKYNILIEVDGDFWHSNPIKYPNGPKYITQIKNSEKDNQKNEWAQQNGYKLLRFWENDINNNINKVKQILMESIN